MQDKYELAKQALITALKIFDNLTEDRIIKDHIKGILIRLLIK